MNKIKTFTLGGCDWNVTFTKSTEDFDGYIGVTNTVTKTIDVTTEYSNLKPTEDTINETYYHELVHAILDTMGHKLGKDECFVQSFGSLLYQHEKTKQ